jgi:hypothetical protein
MLDLILPNYNFALDYARKLVADIPDERMCDQPVPGQVMNHPAFLLGHLAWAKDNALRWLGAQPALAAEWVELFSMGAQPLPDRSRYPSKDLLISTLQEAHARLRDAVAAATPQALAQPAPERMRSRFPTLGNVMLALMTSHFAGHLGQISAWRRASGLPSVL